MRPGMLPKFQHPRRSQVAPICRATIYVCSFYVLTHSIISFKNLLSKAYGRKLLSIVKRLIIFILFIFFTVGASECVYHSQKAEDLFADGKFPQLLELLANPPIDPEVESRAIKINRHDTLRVGVIDDGFAYDHPALAHRINYKIEGGRITGAGLDVFGNDPWPYASLIEPELFAFGAKQIRDDGKIVGPPDDPVALFEKYNEQFMSGLLDLIKNDPQLNKTLFNKLSRESMNVLGTIQILHSQYDILDFNQRDYDEMISKKILITPEKNWEVRLQAIKGEYKLSEGGLKTRMLVIDLPWFMDIKEGKPYQAEDGRDVLRIIEGADVFFPKFKKYYQEFAKESGFEEALKNYIKFRRHYSLDTVVNESQLYREAATNLQKAWVGRRSPSLQGKYSLVALANEFRDRIPYSLFRELASDKISSEEKQLLVRNYFKNGLSSAKKVFEYIASGNFDRDKIKDAKRISKNFDVFEQRILDLLEKHGAYALFTNFRHQLDPIENSNGYAQYGDAVFNPFLHFQDKDLSHGTHVSAIIAAQDEGLFIEPIRVITGKKIHTHAFDEGLGQSYLADFKEWLKNPIVIRAIYEEFRPLLDPEGKRDPLQPQNAETLKQALMTQVSEHVTKKLETYRSNYEFIKEINKAISHVGEQKIKLVNISLGMDFSTVPTRFNPNDLEGKWDDIVEFLRFEFYKYSIGKTIQEKAPHTLFFIATGNGGKWLDGKSRSSLPVDISSPFIKAREEKWGAQVPNNHLNNILAVGSISSESEVSAYSNIPINNVPFVFAVGEAVNSAIKLTDPMGVVQELETKFEKKLDDFMASANEDNSIQMLIDLGLLAPYKADATSHEKLLDRINASKQLSFFTKILLDKGQDLLLMDACVNSIVCHAKYNGTSMATPHAAGVLARLVRQKMQQMGLQDADIYNHPEFSPAKLIELAYQSGEKMGGFSILKDTTKLVGTRPYVVQPKTSFAEQGACAHRLTRAP